MKSLCKRPLVHFLPSRVLLAPEPRADECASVGSSVTVGISGRLLDPVVGFCHSDPWPCFSQTMLLHKLNYLWFLLLFFSPTSYIHKNHWTVINAYMILSRCFSVSGKTRPEARIVFLKMARDGRP